MVNEEQVMQALQTVEDPELEISIVDLGLIYAVRFEDREEGKHAEIDLTLTSPGCPAAPDRAAAGGTAAEPPARPRPCANAARPARDRPSGCWRWRARLRRRARGGWLPLAVLWSSWESR